jgi:hypothetical protein
MTGRIRSSAIASGWPAEVASKVSLEYDGKKFALNIDPEFKNHVLDHEFGTETMPPKSVLRKHLLHPTEFNNIMGHHLQKRWSGKK